MSAQGPRRRARAGGAAKCRFSEICPIVLGKWHCRGGAVSFTGSTDRGRGSRAGTDPREGCSCLGRRTGRHSGGRWREQVVVRAGPIWHWRSVVARFPGYRGDRDYRSQGGYDGENSMPRDQKFGPSAYPLTQTRLILHSSRHGSIPSRALRQIRDNRNAVASARSRSRSRSAPTSRSSTSARGVRSTPRAGIDGPRRAAPSPGR